MIGKTIKIEVEMPDGSIKVVTIAPSDDSKAIKVKIAEQTGMAAPTQVLKLNGTELPGTN